MSQQMSTTRSTTTVQQQQQQQTGKTTTTTTTTTKVISMTESLNLVKRLIESQSSIFLKRPRVIFISLMHLFWSYRNIPIDVLYTSLFIFRCKASWIFEYDSIHNINININNNNTNTIQHVSLTSRVKQTAFENLLEKIRLDKNFMELLIYKNKLKQILWIDPNINVSTRTLNPSSQRIITPTRTACNWSPIGGNSVSQTVTNEWAMAGHERQMTPLTMTSSVNSEYYRNSEVSATCTNTTINSIHNPVTVNPVSGYGTSSPIQKSLTVGGVVTDVKFVAASPIHNTTPLTDSNDTKNDSYSETFEWKSPPLNAKESTIPENEQKFNNDKSSVVVGEQKKSPSTKSATTMVAPVRMVHPMPENLSIHDKTSSPSLISLRDTEYKMGPSLSGHLLWEMVSNFLCSFKDLVTDEHYNRLLIDPTWWKWKVESVCDKAVRMACAQSNNTNKISNDKKPYVQKLVMETNNPHMPRLVKTQIINIESMLNLMEHCNELNMILLELNDFEGRFNPFSEILHQSNPTLVPMVLFDFNKYWTKCVLLSACFHSVYYDGIDYKMQIIDPMFTIYQLPIPTSCTKGKSFSYGDEFDEDCDGFVFVHY